ncbi:MAG: zinc-dependent alcohol dehydrogenase family protein [Paracoccus sp. (in: a-proteobacteria)]|uniref:zinc-dependent alcohol dehydrogenase family protein n=1 Tax=Paracoccus sp. TaxID=267 RepID=UPI003241E791
MSDLHLCRVVRFHQLGGPAVLRLEHEEPQAPQPDEVQLRVEAIALNRADAMFRRGTYLEKPTFPARSGFEASGVITAVGVDIADFRIGDRVNVIPGASVARHCTAADWLTLPARHVIRQPFGLDALQAAAFWMSFVTAYGALVEHCRLSAGQWVLITAASSSVGLTAIQIARAVGARPIATILDDGLRAAMFDAGAEAVIVSDQEDLGARLLQITGGVAAGGGLHAAFDAVGGPQVAAIAEAMRPSGTIVIHGALSPQPTPFPLKVALRHSLALRGYVYTDVTGIPDVLTRAARFAHEAIAAGHLMPRIDRVFPLDRVVDAHRHLESGTAFGKIVLRP